MPPALKVPDSNTHLESRCCAILIYHLCFTVRVHVDARVAGDGAVDLKHGSNAHQAHQAHQYRRRLGQYIEHLELATRMAQQTEGDGVLQQIEFKAN